MTLQLGNPVLLLIKAERQVRQARLYSPVLLPIIGTCHVLVKNSISLYILYNDIKDRFQSCESPEKTKYNNFLKYETCM